MTSQMDWRWRRDSSDLADKKERGTRSQNTREALLIKFYPCAEKICIRVFVVLVGTREVSICAKKWFTSRAMSDTSLRCAQCFATTMQQLHLMYFVVGNCLLKRLSPNPRTVCRCANCPGVWGVVKPITISNKQSRPTTENKHCSSSSSTRRGDEIQESKGESTHLIPQRSRLVVVMRLPCTLTSQNRSVWMFSGLDKWMLQRGKGRAERRVDERLRVEPTSSVKKSSGRIMVSEWVGGWVRERERGSEGVCGWWAGKESKKTQDEASGGPWT